MHRINANTIPESVTSIGDYAFYGCTGLTQITIPESVTSIGRSSFYGCDSLTIYGYKKSYAETYAKKENIPFIPLDLDEKYSVSISVTPTLNESKSPIPSYAAVYSKADKDTVTYDATYDEDTNSFVFDYVPKAGDKITVTIKSIATNKIVKTYEYLFNKDNLKNDGGKLAIVLSESTSTDSSGNETTNLDVEIKTVKNDTDTPKPHDTDTDTDTPNPHDTDTDTDTPKPHDTDTDTDDPKEPDKPTPTKPNKLGDIDGDGRITAADSLLILRRSVSLEKLTKEQEKLADVDCDGSITSADSLEVLRASVGLKGKWNIGEPI